MKLTRSSKIFLRYLPGPLLMIVFCWLIWLQFQRQATFLLWDEVLQKSMQGSGPLLLGSILFLMVINWLLEAVKWKMAVASVQPVSLFLAYKAVLSGISFSIGLPNRIGEYLGRVIYLSPAHRVAAISVTIVSSFSQLIITLAMGCIGWIGARSVLSIQSGWLERAWWPVLLTVCLLLVIMFLLYFKISDFNSWLQYRLLTSSSTWVLRLTKSLMALDNCRAALLRTMLLLSLLRYGVFMAQYYLAYELFQVSLTGMALFITVSLTFLILAIVPTFAIAELGLRGAVGIWIAGWFVGQAAEAGSGAAGVLLAALLIWIVNLILPALLGALLIGGIRNFFNVKDEIS